MLTSKTAIILLNLVIFSFISVFFLLQPTDYLVSAFVIDDGLYYLEIPRNIVAGDGVTYDNRTITNGFHPLWGGVGIILVFLAGPDSATLLRTAMGVQLLFVMLSLIGIWVLAIEISISRLGIITAMTALFYSRFDLWLSTMESSAFLLVIIWLIVLSIRKNLLSSRKLSDSIFLGCLLALLFLVRLDSIFIVFVFLLYQTIYAFKAKFKLSNLKPVLVSGGIFTLLTAPYLLLNRLYFGSIIPVSGLSKLTHDSSITANFSKTVMFFITRLTNKLHLPVIMFIAIIIILFILFSWLCMQPKIRTILKDSCRGGVLPAMVIGTLARGLFLMAFSTEYATVPWYWVPEYLTFFLLIGVSITMLVRLLNRTWLNNSWFLLVATLIISFTGFRYLRADARLYQQSNRVIYDCAAWAKENIQSGKLFAMVDSGIFAFFSNFDVIPLNGLITDRPTMEKIHRGEYLRVMTEFEIDYLVNYIKDDHAIPGHITLYRSEVIPRGIYGGHRIMIFKFKDYPEAFSQMGLNL